MEDHRLVYTPPRIEHADILPERGLAMSPSDYGVPGTPGGAIPIIDENGDPLW